MKCSTNSGATWTTFDIDEGPYMRPFVDIWNYPVYY